MTYSKKILSLFFVLLLAGGLHAQTVSDSTSTDLTALEKRIAKLEHKTIRLSAVKLSGYLQTQWVWEQEDKQQINIRRGRIKTEYDVDYAKMVLQIDITENGVASKDAYIRLNLPKISYLSATVGLFDRPFGKEAPYSSSLREAPERSRVLQALLPSEREIGAKVSLTFNKDSPDKVAMMADSSQHSFWERFVLEAGLFNGNGVAGENSGDTRKDFIGHLAYQHYVSHSFKWGLGVSHYNGSVLLKDGFKAYRLVSGEFVADSPSAKKYLKREYMGLDAQVSIESPLGVSSLHGEMLWGMQVGNLTKSTSTSGSKIINNADLYLRNFSGASIYFVHDIGTSKHSAVMRYNYYDPNTKLKATDEHFTVGDRRYDAYGLGYLFRATKQLRFMAYYEFVRNELGINESDIKDDVFTFRIQIKF